MTALNDAVNQLICFEELFLLSVQCRSCVGLRWESKSKKAFVAIEKAILF